MQKKIGIIHWVCAGALRQYFSGDQARMAQTLAVSEMTLNIALKEEGSSEEALLIERLLCFCMGNHLSVDDLLAHYRQDD